MTLGLDLALVHPADLANILAIDQHPVGLARVDHLGRNGDRIRGGAVVIVAADELSGSLALTYDLVDVLARNVAEIFRRRRRHRPLLDLLGVGVSLVLLAQDISGPAVAGNGGPVVKMPPVFVAVLVVRLNVLDGVDGDLRVGLFDDSTVFKNNLQLPPNVACLQCSQPFYFARNLIELFQELNTFDSRFVRNKKYLWSNGVFIDIFKILLGTTFFCHKVTVNLDVLPKKLPNFFKMAQNLATWATFRKIIIFFFFARK